MVKNTQKNVSVSDHFVGLMLKGLVRFYQISDGAFLKIVSSF